MMRRAPSALIAMVLVWVVAAAGASSAAGQSAGGRSGVGDLWDQYPLEEPTPTRQRGGGVTSDADGRVAPRGAPSVKPQATPLGTPDRPPPADRRDAGSSDGLRLVAALLATLAAVGLVLAASIRRVGRRRRTREATYPVWAHGTNVHAEGFTERDGIGSFRGFVYAMGSETGPEADRMLCVHDADRDTGVWVRRSEIESLLSQPAAPMPNRPDAPSAAAEVLGRRRIPFASRRHDAPSSAQKPAG